MIVSILAIVCSFILFNIYYRKYYSHMKKDHYNEWIELMNKDPIVEASGEWTRWPFGSIYLIKSVFKMNEFYNDDTIKIYKNKFVFYFKIFTISFVLLMFSAALLSK